ncbi:Bacterial alpha-L-rhamnosidase [uncultured Flavonifractor sp.]|nr:Bacterial alpha-L-rhamnosidase [uncultured Flavonifractor sp.]
MRAIRLKTEYLTNPVGIDIVNPRLSWNCTDGKKQSAYEICIRDELGTEIWNSGKVSSARMTGISCGIPLHSRDIRRWKVRLWDETDVPGPWSEEASFEVGLLHESDWRAAWITGDYRARKKERYPVDCFQKRFSVHKPLRRARLYATACGVYEGALNGQRIGNYILAPGVSEFTKRLQYQTTDVLPLLKEGENTLTFQLADGWFRGSVGAWGSKWQYGVETKLLAQLELTDMDGSVTTICTDGSWCWSNDGPIRFADNKDGEIVDARMLPSYDKKARVTSYDVIPTSANSPDLVEQERFSAKLLVTPSGKTVLDFGQNIAGYLSFKLQAKAGQRISLRFGEMLDSRGEFTQKNIQCSNKKITTPLQQVCYTCCDGVNVYKPRFAIFGFQYVLVETDVPFAPEDFTAIAVYSDLEQTGFFHCSDDLINQFVDCTLWSAKDNSADLPTDCPTRERHGWTGDAQIFYNTAGYLFDYAAFARKFVRGMVDTQKKNGCYKQIVPTGGIDAYMSPMDGSVGWSDAGVMIPYRQWKLYGDVSIIRDNYDSMCLYARFMIRRCGKWYITAKPLHVKSQYKKYIVNCGQAYGEWAEPEDVRPFHWTDMSCPHPEEATAYTSYVMGLMAEIADHLGKTEDAKLFGHYQELTKRAYQDLSRTKQFTLDTDRQARLVRPLYFGLLDQEQRAFAKARLIKALDHYGWRLGTGFLSTPLILDVLTDIDPEYAYRLLENKQMPGWLFMPLNGATTVWESWEGISQRDIASSLNHYSKGAVCEWIFRTMCGIRVAGENRFEIAPCPGGSLTHAAFTYKSVYGEVSSRWEKRDGRIFYTITIPTGTTAVIRLPGGKETSAEAGTYTYQEVDK